MKTALEQKVLHNIRNAQMIAAGDRIGVAVSGGADSVALVRILRNIRGELGVTLLVVHFDHMLRGGDSDRDACFVEGLARELRLPFVAAREDVAAAATSQGWNLEDAARRLRYAFFERVCAAGQATRIAVAHTTQDQAETVLAHLIRGTGPTGLAGIYPTSGPVIRPLLEIKRVELRAYLRGLNQTWREDTTNRDTARLRARIREQLIPALERDFSPAIVSHLGELARLAREEETFWTSIVEDRFHAHARKIRETICISVRDLLSPMELTADVDLSSGALKSSNASPLRTLTERLIRRLYQGARGDRKDLTAQHVEQVIRLATGTTSGRHLELPGDIVVERRFDELIFSPANRARSGASVGTLAKPSAYQYVVSIPTCGTTVVPIPELGICFRLKVIDWALQPSDTKSYGQALDADLLRGSPLILRNWRPGDAYRPHGRQHARKLKEMFSQYRVPGHDRSLWPVLESAGRVIWTRGLPPAADLCACQNTVVAVSIEEHPFESRVHS